MAGKRVATTELNDENWNADEEPEDSGTFKRAPEEVLQKRSIKMAKRRNPVSSNNEAATKSVFSTFTAFNKTSTPSTAFSFLNNLAATKDASAVNGVNNSSSNIFTQPNKVDANITFKGPENKTLNNEADEEYYAKLKGLNESVSSWIKKHVDNNPFINLKPIFKDYEKYFNELEILKTSKSSVENIMNKSSDVSTSFKNELSSFVFNPVDTPKDKTKEATSTLFSANMSTKESNITTTTIPTFTFGSGPTTANTPAFTYGSNMKASSNTNFIFGNPTTKPFTFTNVTKPISNEETAIEEQDEDEPPKVEFTPVVEDGHTYTVRCKVFVKNQDSFGDRGVGTLYLKPVPNSEKIQLIVRADTNLGNLLCNFILSKSIPVKRMGKKDVMLVCLPTLESKPPPVPILLRVKSPEQADELYSELDKHKK